MLLGAMAKITVPPPCDHPIRPGPDAPFAIRGDVARAETIGKQHNVPMRGQELRPSRPAPPQARPIRLATRPG